MTVGEYNKCVDRFSDNVYRFVIKSLKDEDTSRDIVQESFMRLWENVSSAEFGKARSYIFTVAYHLIVDHTRHRKKYRDSEPVFDRLETPDRSFNNLNQILSDALDELNDTQRNLILLRDYEGYSYREIGEMTGLSESQVKVYIFRARVLVKNKIGSLDNII